MDEYIWPKITKKTTIKELKEIHHQIWNHVIANNFRKPSTPYFSDCVACEYAIVRYGNFSRCTCCPIKWPDGQSCFDHDSQFAQFWNHAKQYHRDCRDAVEAIEAMQYAIAIRDMEWKDDDND